MWNFFTRFQLDFQAGGPRDAREPIEICLRYSDDQGATWSDELWQTVDSLGNYSAIAQWFSLGRGRDRVWEVSSTSEAMTVWLAAYIDVIPGTHG
jgi:Neuraminidase (sialidase)